MDCGAIAAAILALSSQTGETYECADSEAGLAVARDRASAEHFLQAMETGQQAFIHHFDRTPAPAAIVHGNAARNSLTPALEAAGFGRVLPWIDVAEEAEQQRLRIRAQIEAQAAGLPDAQIDAMVARAQAGRADEITAIDPEIERAAIAHELGHLWYIDNFWPIENHGAAHYGGQAPDWLDEMAGVALETGALLDDRRGQLRDSDGQTPLPLEEFLRIEHPLATLAAAIAERTEMMSGGTSSDAAPEGGMRMIRLSGADAEALMAEASIDPGSYYVMARGFLDYLTDRAGAAPLAEISTALGNEIDFETWLALEGARHGLPTSLDALNADWETWLASR